MNFEYSSLDQNSTSMKQQSFQLRSFIKDYKLERETDVVCFMADIHFTAANTDLDFMGKVYIVTLSFNGRDVVYLISADLERLQIDSMFANSYLFSYSLNKKFSIDGHSERYGDYHLVIDPQCDCEAPNPSEFGPISSN